MTLEEILNKLPFENPFLFVDELYYVNENGASGCFTFHKDLYFFDGHFKNHPIVPGTILTETMAQIGGACLGIFLNSQTKNNEKSINSLTVATSYNMDFFKPVYPGEKVIVISEKEYFRFGKLKYKVMMKNEKEEIVAQGMCTGMIKTLQNE